jgi:hypothetical protein
MLKASNEDHRDGIEEHVIPSPRDSARRLHSFRCCAVGERANR